MLEVERVLEDGVGAEFTAKIDRYGAGVLEDGGDLKNDKVFLFSHGAVVDGG